MTDCNCCGDRVIEVDGFYNQLGLCYRCFECKCFNKHNTFEEFTEGLENISDSSKEVITNVIMLLPYRCNKDDRQDIVNIISFLSKGTDKFKPFSTKDIVSYLKFTCYVYPNGNEDLGIQGMKHIMSKYLINP